MQHDLMCPDNHQRNWSDCWTCRVINLARNDEREEAAKRVAAVEGGYSIPPEMPVGAFIDAMRREMVQAARGKGSA